MKKCISWRFGNGEENSKSMLWYSKVLRRTACRKQNLTINGLPDSILVYLFSFLTFLELCDVSRVCKQWYILSKDFSLRRIIELREHSVTTSQVKQLICYHFNSFLVELHLRGQSRSLWLTPFTPKILAKLQKVSPNLRCLIMEDFNFRSLTSEKCVRLQDFPLTLHHLSIRNSIIDRSVFFCTNTGIPVAFDLEILDLGRCVYLADGNIHQWPKLPQLKELFLEGCPFIDKHLLENIMGLQRTLKVLDIEGSYGFETAVFIIGENTVNLEELYVGCTLTKDCNLFLITKGMFKHLKKLCLSETRVTDTGLEHLTSIVLSLTWLKLDMTRVSNQCISNVRRLLPKVVVIKNTNVTVFRVFRNEGCAHYQNKAHHLL